VSHRLCVIGNSHVAAFATGWKTLAAHYPDVTVTFYASHGTRIDQLEPVRGALRANSRRVRETMKWVSGGGSAIVGADHDEFWLVGCRCSVKIMMAVYAAAWSESHAPDPRRTPVSDAAFASAAASLLRGSGLLTLHGKLRPITSAPISLFPDPNPSSAVLGSADERVEPLRVAARSGDGPALWGQYRAACDQLAREQDLTFCHQPDETREDGIFTVADYGRGSIRLTRGLEQEHPESDPFHMNAAYGALMFERFLSPSLRGPASGDNPTG